MTILSTASREMCRPRSLKLTSSNNKRKPLRGSFLDEFSQASGIFRSDVVRSVRERLYRRPRHHHLDEFSCWLFLGGLTPALPAFASPTDPHSALKSSCRSSVCHRTVSSVLTACLTSGGHPNPSGAIHRLTLRILSSTKFKAAIHINGDTGSASAIRGSRQRYG